MTSEGVLSVRRWAIFSSVTVALLLSAVLGCSSNEDATAIPTATLGLTATTAISESDAASQIEGDATQEVLSPTATAVEPISIVTTSNIVGEWVDIVGGERVDVLSLVPRQADPHSYRPGARDIARVTDAEVVFSVGLSLEESWMQDLLENASTSESKVVALGDYLVPLPFSDAMHEEEGEHAEHSHMESEEDDHAHMEGEEDEHADHEGHEGEGALSGRLLVADADEASVSVVDLMSDDVSLDVFDVAAKDARVYSSPNHRFGYALARGEGENDDRVDVFDGGVYLVPHGDHDDLVIRPVSEMALGTADDRPIHFTNGGEWTAIFHDGTGRVGLFNEHEMSDAGDDYEVVYLQTGLQHGAAVPIGDELFAVTVANPDFPEKVQSSLPIGVEIRNLSDETVYDASAESCPGMHGEAHNHEGSMYGCVGGVLFIESHGGEFEHWFIDNPEEMSAEARIGTVWGHHDSEHFFGKASRAGEMGFVDEGIWLIRPEEREMRLVLPVSPEGQMSVGSAFSADGETLYVLTFDGMLVSIDAHDGEIISRDRLVDAIDPSATPSFIVVGEMLYLADRAGERVIEYSLHEMKIEREWHVHGAPSSVVFLGVASRDGVVHDEAGHMEHEDENDGHAEHDEDEDGHTARHIHVGGEDDHADHGDSEDGHEGHDHGEFDPHFWLDPIRVGEAVHVIAHELSELMPGFADEFEANAEAYEKELEDLDVWIKDRVSGLDEHRRLLITTHDSFGYFADRYGFEVVGVIIPGGGTEVEPSPIELARLSDEIRERGVSAVFSEAQISDRMARTLADETGVSVVGGLLTGSLDAVDGTAGTYVGMMMHNVDLIVGALLE